MSWEPKFPTERDVIVNPSTNVSKKLIQVLEGYKTRFDNFRPIKIDRLD